MKPIPERSRLRLLAVCLATVCVGSSGCSYSGAIYGSQQKFGLGIHLTTSDTTPVEMNVGYDQAVIAYVPRRGPEGATDEATAIISKNDLRTISNPTQLKSNPILQVDAALISGTAAIVASTTPGKTVEVSVGDRSQTLPIVGNAGERISTALTGDPAALSEVQQKFAALHHRLAALAPDRSTSVYDHAASSMPEEFRSLYQQRRGAHPAVSASDIFRSVTDDYLGYPPNTSRRDALERALQAAAGGV